MGLGLAGAAAAAITAAAVVLPGGGTPPSPPASAVTGPAVTGPAVTASQKVRLSARDVLLAAAANAGRQSETTGDWWHTTTVSRALFTVADGGYRVETRSRDEMWTPRAPGGEQWSRGQTLGARPAGEEDRRAWAAAGSPERVGVEVPGKKARMRLPMAPGEVRTDHSPLVDGDKVFWLGRNVTMKDLRGLPDEPEALREWLLRSYEGHDTESASVPMGSDVWLFKVSAGLITDMPVTPEVRGAAFRMLAGLDTVEVAEDVTDAEGRAGTAVSIEEHAQGGATLANRLIFDEATGRALANEIVVVEPGGLQAGLEPGTVSSSSAVLEAGWTDTGPRR
ncbi:CU044_5270 family protein [Actinomadura sp. ATCC 31491]|uniref:CU044_5270 family protein n=1 Tax=Actinomadura luzonensis TaxID=2805427 RepID=A0ABT0FL84_9ACTN|nr:CU044_5270 family protein [Actinomadura luzonensis]